MNIPGRNERVTTLIRLFQRSHQITSANPFLTDAQLDSIASALYDSVNKVLDQEFRAGFDTGYEATLAEFSKQITNLRLP